ncbi:DUF4153 domain-containing protein [Terrihabitans rhizophilus]|uniref:DUF4153 domain-containing protein n=1 Tax=Terrihabitans rhizophilus TaxID=3092662 RepID=A0ABU4RRR8_9HYPH|nr:DUF4153 domain-containing protein [Terrihabitans sp. PJ23]MDX6805456.1 DUF4153 domain-containing protein [Terrihabitans sp. PJ23]
MRQDGSGFLSRIKALPFAQADLQRAVTRFPVAVAASVIVTAMAIAEIHDRLDHTMAEMVGIGCLVAFAASVAAGVMSEAHGLGRGRALLQLLAATTGAISAVFHESHWFSPEAAGVAAIALAATGSLSLLRDEERRSWVFNLSALSGLAFAGLSTLVIMIGLAAILYSIRYLFGITVTDTVMQYVWALGFALVLPLLWLSLLGNRQSPEAPDGLIRRAVAALGIILAVLAAIYAVVLHLYAAKIALTMDVPRNQVGWIVSAFLFIGNLGLLASYRPDGDVAPAVRWIRRLWFPMTAVPVALLALATWQRIGAYGVTPERHVLALITAAAVMLLACFVVLRERFDIRLVPGVVLLLAVATMVGPLTFKKTTIRSQSARLDVLLDRWAQRSGGAVTGVRDDAPEAARQDIASAAGVLLGLGALDTVRQSTGRVFANADEARALLRTLWLMPAATVHASPKASAGGTRTPFGLALGPFSLGKESVQPEPFEGWLSLQDSRVTLASTPPLVFDLKWLADGVRDGSFVDVPISVTSVDGASALILNHITAEGREALEITSVAGVLLLGDGVTPPPALSRPSTPPRPPSPAR